jgi:predicted 3-demethylubiquinone-9 3-methyltransferase (glyoxalase superfamily)
MKGITPCLWFDNQAEEAARFYTSIFENSKLGTISYYGEAGSKASGRPKGSVMTVEFELDGRKFLALNGGPEFKFTEAISLVANCKNQDEVDEIWSGLTAGGSESVCGWLKDRYGLSWQVTPTILQEMIEDDDPERADRVMAAMLTMRKIDIATLKEAYEGSPVGARR